MNTFLGSAFPDMEMEKTLKFGEHGSVHLVRDRETKTRYIYREFSGSGEVFRKLREIRSENLPKVYDVKEQDGRVFVLEEYIQGDTLAFLLENGPLKESYAKEIAMQICKALGILHSSGIVHRDIKPENILVRGTEAVLIDFDAARLVKPEHRTDTQIMGTTGYAAPEQYGFSQTDARADIYSLGIVFNEMLIRQHPSKQLAQGKFRPVIERCTEMNMDERYRSADEMYTAIASCREQPKKKRAWGIVLAFLVAVALCVGLAPFFGRNKIQTPEGLPTLSSVPAEQETEAPSADGQAPTGPEVLITRKQVEISGEHWTGPPARFMTPFSYDLDGDGEPESYQFGIYQADVPEGHQDALLDYFALEDGGMNTRRVYPCVWQYREDGALEVVTAFASLLTNPEIKVWCGSEEDVPAPEAFTVDGVWPGGIELTYTLDQLGVWVYEIHAELGGQTLTAVAQSTVDTYENYLKNYT